MTSVTVYQHIYIDIYGGNLYVMFGSNTDLEAIIISEHLFTFSVVSSLALHSANTSRFPSMMLMAGMVIIRMRM